MFESDLLLVGVWAFTVAIIFLYYSLYWKPLAKKFPLSYSSTVFITILLWIICGYSLTNNGLQDGVVGNLSDAFFWQVSSQPMDDLFNLIFSKKLFFSILSIILLQMAMVNRIKKLSGIIFSIGWLLLVSYPVLFMTQGPGLIAQSGINDLYGSFSIHILTGSSALAIILYAKPAQLLKSSLSWNYRPILITMAVAILYFFFQWHCSQSGISDYSIFLQTFALALGTQVVIKVINRIKVRIWDPAACLVATIAFISGFGMENNPSFIIICSISIGFICYFFLDYLNYSEIDPAYLVFVIHGISGLCGLLVVSIYFSLNTNNQHLPINLERHVGVGIVLGAYAFLITYLMLGFINRFMIVREAQD